MVVEISTGFPHRIVDRGILSHVSSMNFQFWAVLGSQGCREKKDPNLHKYATFEGSFFLFSWAKNSEKLRTLKQ
mgnify:CR=1 FL=1